MHATLSNVPVEELWAIYTVCTQAEEVHTCRRLQQSLKS